MLEEDPVSVLLSKTSALACTPSFWCQHVAECFCFVYTYEWNDATCNYNYSVKFDGVETIPGIVEIPSYRVPYRATGRQFYQYRLIVDYLTNDKPQQLPGNSLSTAELCMLHDIISNAVQVWERGDEHRTCPELRSMPQRR